jgi:hypothetical protein
MTPQKITLQKRPFSVRVKRALRRAPTAGIINLKSASAHRRTLNIRRTLEKTLEILDKEENRINGRPRTEQIERQLASIRSQRAKAKESLGWAEQEIKLITGKKYAPK